ncbi:MAG: TonB C-terminal domain-containing protein [Elusimicrobia bacterium]|nr:TonB C-terminal domain-containing protein [Elusimicrobiota bacterium]
MLPRQYLIYSSIFHALLVFTLAFVSRPYQPGLQPTSYHIDFIGPGGIVSSAGKSATQNASSFKSSTQTELPLPRPSILSELEATESHSAQQSLPKTGARPLGPDKTTPSVKGIEKNPDTSEASESGGGTQITADFPNFPYPWYITQVRTNLWDQWSSRMPRGGNFNCLVVFKIQKDGHGEGFQVERSSGNRLFDYAALTSAEQSAPFPPLPTGFREPELTVHVEFRSL